MKQWCRGCRSVEFNFRKHSPGRPSLMKGAALFVAALAVQAYAWVHPGVFVGAPQLDFIKARSREILRHLSSCAGWGARPLT